VASTNAALLSRETIARWRGSPSLRRTLARLAAGAVACACGLGALAVGRGPGETTTYAGQSEVVAALALVAGVALVVAGVVTSVARQGKRNRRPRPARRLSLVRPGLCRLEGWAAARPECPLAAVFTLPVLLHIVVAFPSGLVRSSGARALVIPVYLEAALCTLGRALFRDPFVAPACWDNCTDNVFLVHSLSDVARVIEDVDLWFAACAAAALAALCV
jgi:hypothetical protein